MDMDAATWSADEDAHSEACSETPQVLTTSIEPHQLLNIEWGPEFDSPTETSTTFWIIFGTHRIAAIFVHADGHIQLIHPNLKMELQVHENLYSGLTTLLQLYMLADVLPCMLMVERAELQLCNQRMTEPLMTSWFLACVRQYAPPVIREAQHLILEMRAGSMTEDAAHIVRNAAKLQSTNNQEPVSIFTKARIRREASNLVATKRMGRTLHRVSFTNRGRNQQRHSPLMCACTQCDPTLVHPCKLNKSKIHGMRGDPLYRIPRGSYVDESGVVRFPTANGTLALSNVKFGEVSKLRIGIDTQLTITVDEYETMYGMPLCIMF